MFTNVVSMYIHEAKSTIDVGSDVASVKLSSLEQQQKVVLMEYTRNEGLDEFVEAVEPWRDISGLWSSPIFFQINPVYQNILPLKADHTSFKS